MKAAIGIYVHHHGSGHRMRALQLAAAIKDRRVLLIGSNLKDRDILGIENASLVHLPMDTLEEDEGPLAKSDPPAAFHYAPLGIKGIRARAAILAELFKVNYPMLLVVDVSVEVTLFARLCGVPTVVIMQHGIRDDIAHQMAYQSAELILAPFNQAMYMGKETPMFHKTIFAGGFSRFDNIPEREYKKNSIAVMIGKGGSSIKGETIIKIARQLTKCNFHVIGLDKSESTLANISWHGAVENPSELLLSCEIIIGNTGHNTVMEVAALGRRFIGVPEDRPFCEQEQKAEAISNRKGIRIIGIKEFEKQDWPFLIKLLQQENVDWDGIINPGAIKAMVAAITDQAWKIFGH